MTIPLSPPDLNDRNLYSLHQEANVPETSLHERVVRYLRYAIEAFRQGWFVTGNVCIYLKPDPTSAPIAPDLFVVKEPLPETDPRVYQIWRDPPISFVAEVASRSTFQLEEGVRLEKYQDSVRAPEHLLYDPERQTLKLRRLGPRGYRVVSPNARGRLRSEQLGLEFGLDEDGFLWLYSPDGERLMTHEEEVIRRQEAETRAQELERELAALRARLEQQ
jgi:Uma2 family endonuclease